MESRKKLFVYFIAMSIAITSHTGAVPIVPDCSTEEYATGINPVMITFSPNGTVFVGNNYKYVSIYRILPDGSVDMYGEPTYDPDGVFYDEYGNISGTPGSVLVSGGSVLGPAHFTAILPDQTNFVICPPPDVAFININDFVMNSTGTLLGVDSDSNAVFKTNGGCLTNFFSTGMGLNIAIDSMDNIYISHNDGTIKVYDQNGNLIDNNYAEGLPNRIPLAFGPGDEFWGNALYVLDTSQNNLRRYSSDGTYTIAGTGFDSFYLDMEFGPDNNLYLSDYDQGIIWRIRKPPCPPLPPHEPWSFVHITDTHIGCRWDRVTGTGCESSPAEDQLATFVDYLNDLTGDEVPDLILVTGDVAHYACYDVLPFPICPGFYRRYIEALDQLDHEELRNKIYTLPGNHERYTGFPPGCKSLCLYCYDNKINPTRPPDAQDLDSFSPNDYYFEHNGFLFIGLDSGRDVGCWTDIRGTGLANPQMEALEDLDLCTRKIIFMHHPAVHTDDTHIISDNRPRFVNYCLGNNVQLVLTGHTHDNLVFDRNGTPVTEWDEADYPLFIQTPSLGKDTHEYRIIDVIGGTANPRVPAEIVEPTALAAENSSAADLHIYDSLGRHVGLVSSGEVEREIPRSFYFSYYAVSTDQGEQVLPEKIIIFEPSDDYIYELRGTEEGSYKLKISYASGGEETTFEATEIPTSPGARHVYIVDWDALSAGEEGVILDIDADGDGVFERTVIADEDLTSDEFALQTETVVDFQPDVLNLGSQGQFVTVYVELPEGFEASQIDVSSLMLNTSVPALSTPVEIGDYDSDGIADLMVKFARQQVAEVLEVGEQIVYLAGRLADGTLFAGIDTIQVLASKGGEEAIAAEEAAGFTLLEAAERINELDPENFNNEDSATALTNEIDFVLSLIYDEGLLTEALYVLENDILERTNGCADIGEPDENDWITTYEGQGEVYPLIVEAIELLESLIQ
jgi:hypothetical protein